MILYFLLRVLDINGLWDKGTIRGIEIHGMTTMITFNFTNTSIQIVNRVVHITSAPLDAKSNVMAVDFSWIWHEKIIRFSL